MASFILKLSRGGLRRRGVQMLVFAVAVLVPAREAFSQDGGDALREQVPERAPLDREQRQPAEPASLGHRTVALQIPAAVRPGPGDVFREYLWTNAAGDAGGALRVGGRVGYGGEAIPLPHTFDLQQALRAEIVVEKLLCHDGTRGLAISANDHDWIPVLEAESIPQPQWECMHHTYPVVAVPLEHLKTTSDNQLPHARQ